MGVFRVKCRDTRRATRERDEESKQAEAPRSEKRNATGTTQLVEGDYTSGRGETPWQRAFVFQVYSQALATIFIFVKKVIY